MGYPISTLRNELINLEEDTTNIYLELANIGKLSFYKKANKIYIKDVSNTSSEKQVHISCSYLEKEGLDELEKDIAFSLFLKKVEQHFYC